MYSVVQQHHDTWAVLMGQLEIAKCESEAAANWIMSSLRWRDLRIRQLAEGAVTMVGSLRDNWNQIVRVNELDESSQNELWQTMLKVISEQAAQAGDRRDLPGQRSEGRSSERPAHARSNEEDLT